MGVNAMQQKNTSVTLAHTLSNSLPNKSTKDATARPAKPFGQAYDC
ncbi:MAG: hypothetical protein Q8Q50_15345 [Methylobacter sp.]|nr:hypothetical protein [Methylobacter sp.]